MKVIYDFMTNSDTIVSKMIEQCNWGQFTINGKSLTRAGSFEGLGSYLEVPWLRCPSIEKQTIYPMSLIVKEIRDKIYTDLGYSTNIAKIQKYSDGNVVIKRHSDKIIDLEPSTPIFLIRFGATRTVILQHKVTKEIRKIEMPHNTLLILDYKDNIEWTHSIAKDPIIKEPGYSIVFRQSVTFLDSLTGLVYGKHTPFKNKNEINSYNSFNFFYTKEKQTEELVKMYNKENNNVISLEEYRKFMDKAIYP